MKKLCMFVLGNLTPMNTCSFFTFTPCFLDTREHLHTRVLPYPPDCPVIAFDGGISCSSGTAVSFSPTSRTRSIVSRRCNCTPSPLPAPGGKVSAVPRNLVIRRGRSGWTKPITMARLRFRWSYCPQMIVWIRFPLPGRVSSWAWA